MRARATSMLLAALVAVSLTGCTFGAAQTNQKPYDASDGIGSTFGSVDVRNALLVSEDGQTANLSVSLINTSLQNVALKVSWTTKAGTTERNVYIAAGETLSLGTAKNQFLLHDIDSHPGSLFPVYFQYGAEPGRQMQLPVLDGSLPSYTALVPSPGV